MGRIHEPPRALLLLAAFGRDPRALDWARDRAATAWGPVALASDVFDFTETDYYEPTMGSGLKKAFFAFQRAVDPEILASVKVETNLWEEQCATQWPETTTGTRATWQGRGRHRPADTAVIGNADPKGASRAAELPAARLLNLDPGYLTEAKLVLASTKDHAHRIYLSQGIYAEVTLSYRRGHWRHHDWTYPDYQRSDYQAFFDRCRDYFRRCVLRGDPP
jgi:hypothetical protein